MSRWEFDQRSDRYVAHDDGGIEDREGGAGYISDREIVEKLNAYNKMKTREEILSIVIPLRKMTNKPESLRCMLAAYEDVLNDNEFYDVLNRRK